MSPVAVHVYTASLTSAGLIAATGYLSVDVRRGPQSSPGVFLIELHSANWVSGSQKGAGGAFGPLCTRQVFPPPGRQGHAPMRKFRRPAWCVPSVWQRAAPLPTPCPATPLQPYLLSGTGLATKCTKLVPASAKPTWDSIVEFPAANARELTVSHYCPIYLPIHLWASTDDGRRHWDQGRSIHSMCFLLCHSLLMLWTSNNDKFRSIQFLSYFC